MWYVYILRCRDESLYTGITTDMTRRLRQHNGLLGRGARYTLAKRPVSVVYLEKVQTRSEAQKREAAIKHLSHDEKKLLCSL